MLISILHDVGLKTADIEKIQQVFLAHPEVKKAVLYGSRAKGNFKPFSDIDLTLFGSELNLTIQQKIEHELDDLLLPYTFDLTLFEKIDNMELKDHIQRVGRVFFE